MKKIAVITGASSGMGRRFAETIEQYGTFDEVWVIARRAPELEALRKTVPFPIRPLALDLTDRRSFAAYAEALAAEPVEVGLLLNASGFGKFRAVMAVCPFWTKTAFFDRAVADGETPVVKKYVAMYDPADIVRRTWRDAKRKRDVCKYGFIARFQAGLAKLLPHRLVMDVWMHQQDL